LGRRQNATILGSRLGAGDEGTGSDFTSDGETDHVVAGCGDSGDDGPQPAALEVAMAAVRLRRTVRPTARAAESASGADGDGTGSAAALSGEICRLQRASLSRETAGGARDPAELHMGEAGAARGGSGGEGTKARGAPEAAKATAAAGHAVALGREPASLVSGRPLV